MVGMGVLEEQHHGRASGAVETTALIDVSSPNGLFESSVERLARNQSTAAISPGFALPMYNNRNADGLKTDQSSSSSLSGDYVADLSASNFTNFAASFTNGQGLVATRAFQMPPPMVQSALGMGYWPPFSGFWQYGGRHERAGFNDLLDKKCDGEIISATSPTQQSGSAPSEPPPKTPQEMRKLIRKKMHRCKVCKSRFIEKDIYERHLRDRHPLEYEIYVEQQAKIMEEQRMAELEQIRREEIATGGFILPASEVEEALAMADPNEIKLPEEDEVFLMYVDETDGLMKKKKRPFVKKVSPQCPFCDKRFRNDNSLKKHLAKKHPDCINFVQCNRCFKAVRSADDLATHSCDLNHVCWECTPIRNMINAERLDVHRKKFHRGANSGFKCNECNRKFLTPRKLRKHKKMAHIIQKPFKCHFCDEYFPTDTQAALHERIHTGKVKFECNICDFRANRYIRLIDHKQREHGYVCVICGDKTVEWSELKYHTLEVHAGYLSSEGQAGKLLEYCLHCLT